MATEKNKGEKQLGPGMANYKFKGTHPAGKCGKTGVEYNIYKSTAAHIESMIAKGSPLFEKKTKDEKKADK